LDKLSTGKVVRKMPQAKKIEVIVWSTTFFHWNGPRNLIVSEGIAWLCVWRNFDRSQPQERWELFEEKIERMGDELLEAHIGFDDSISRTTGHFFGLKLPKENMTEREVCWFLGEKLKLGLELHEHPALSVVGRSQWKNIEVNIMR
jgi:hypothetical protein